MTDRPVYRPGQKVQWKVWVGHNKYDEDGKSPFAGRTATIEIRGPKNDIVKSVSGTLDDFGGMAGEITLENEATLGSYNLFIPNQNWGGTTFRVEEYKKPEFEVKVDAPTEPAMLGETISATIKANYYFGAPVINAHVKYKVTRTAYSANWYPVGRWDWFYRARLLVVRTRLFLVSRLESVGLQSSHSRLVAQPLVQRTTGNRPRKRSPRRPRRNR